MMIGIPDTTEPWKAPVQWARVRLDIPGWPRRASARMLRGAICGALENHAPEGLHVDWHGHAADGTPRQCIPPVQYRTHDGPEVYFVGPRSSDHVALLSRALHAVRLQRDGDVLEVRAADIESDTCAMQTTGKSWVRYELVSPLFPPDVAWRRRPRDPGHERDAWAAGLLYSSISQVLLAGGIQPDRLRLHVVGVAHERVEWKRPKRSLSVGIYGFRARMVMNARLPPWVGLGKHRAEGFGALQCL